MMFSATDFLPDSIRTLTNLATSVLPNFGSGRISRLGTSRRRGMSIPSCLQLSASFGTRVGHHDLTLTRSRDRLNSLCMQLRINLVQKITSWRPWHASHRTSSELAYG